MSAPTDNQRGATIRDRMELQRFLDADARDLVNHDLPALAALNDERLQGNSSLRGLAHRWRMHRSGRFGWRRSWAGKDRFTDVADLAWPAQPTRLQWSGREWLAPRYSAYRLLGAYALGRLRASGAQNVSVWTLSNPLLSILIATRCADLAVQLGVYSALGHDEATQWLNLRQLPGYILDFLPTPVADAEGHRRIELLSKAQLSRNCAISHVLYIHDLCDLPMPVRAAEDVLAAKGALVLAPRGRFEGIEVQDVVCALDGVDIVAGVVR